MHSIILAAGKGTRMVPLSHYIPKLLIPVRGKPVLAYILESMKSLPIKTHYIVASNHLSTIEKYIQKVDGHDNVKVIQALGWETGGDLAIAMEEIGVDDDVLILNGDTITDFPLADLYKFHKEKGAEVTIAVFSLSDEKQLKAMGVVEVDKEGKVTNFVEKPSEVKKIPSLASVGIYIFDKKFMERRREYLTPRKIKLEMSLFPKLVAEGKLYAYVGTPKYRWDIGTLESYLHAETFMRDLEGVIQK